MRQFNEQVMLVCSEKFSNEQFRFSNKNFKTSGACAPPCSTPASQENFSLQNIISPFCTVLSPSYTGNFSCNTIEQHSCTLLFPDVVSGLYCLFYCSTEKLLHAIEFLLISWSNISSIVACNKNLLSNCVDQQKCIEQLCCSIVLHKKIASIRGA